MKATWTAWTAGRCEEARRPVGVQIATSVALAVFTAGCSGVGPSVPPTGDPSVGRILVARQACGSCHHIPGLGQADGLVGPPLDHFATRTVVAGVLPNTQEALVLWLRSPQSVAPGNAMPDLGLSKSQARDVAAFLYTLR